MNQLNHDLKISPTRSLFRFSNHCSDDTLFVYLCSFLFFILYFHCNDRLVQSVERGTIQFIDWFDSGCIVVWLNVIETRLNRVELEILFFLLFWSSDTTMTEPVEPWLENLTNSIFVQVSKSLQWWHYFNYSEYCYLWKL